MVNHSVDTVLRALSDPGRRSIVERLSAAPLPVSVIAAPMQVSLPAVLKQLDVLEAAGVVRSTKVGRVRTVELDPDALRPLERWVQDRRSVWSQQLDALGDQLEEGVRPAPSVTEQERAHD